MASGLEGVGWLKILGVKAPGSMVLRVLLEACSYL